MLLLTVALASAITARAADTPVPSPAAWSDDFERGNPGGWQAYGPGCKLEATSATSHSGKYALQARFDDTSGVAWANKGARIDLKPGLSWSRFSYLFLYYHLDHSAAAVGYLLHDRAGNWWRAATDSPIVGKWTPAAVSARAFTFAWNDDPNMPPGTKDSEIVEFFLYTSTETVNSGAQFAFTVDEIAFCGALPEGLEAPEAAAPPPALKLPAEEGEHFPLQWRVRNMDARGFLTVDGKPVFPLGLYSCFGIDQSSGAHPESHYNGLVTDEKVHFWLQSMKDAGFNLIQSYTMQGYGMHLAPGVTGAWKPADVLGPTTPERLREGTSKLLDLCARHGLMLMAGSFPPYCATVLPPEPAARAKALSAWKETVRANVLAWRAHPALLAWYLMDEPPSDKLPVRDLVEQYRYLKGLDSDHPWLIASCAPADVQYARAVDIFAPDPYPIETGVPLRAMPARIRPLKAIAEGKPPMPQTWAVIQIAQWQEKKRVPSEDELRLMCLTAMSQGVTGLLFYEFSNYADRDPVHWQHIGRVVRSLQSVIPALLAPGEVVQDVPASDRRVYSLAKRVGKGAEATTWVIAANPSQNLAGEPMGLGRVTFTLTGLPHVAGMSAVALDEDAAGRFQPGASRPVALKVAGKGFTLTDDFGALAAHIYRIGASPASAR